MNKDKDLIEIDKKLYYKNNFDLDKYDSFDRAGVTWLVSSHKNAILVNIQFIIEFLSFADLENIETFDKISTLTRTLFNRFQYGDTNNKDDSINVIMNSIVEIYKLVAQLNKAEHKMFMKYCDNLYKEIIDYFKVHDFSQ